MSNSLQHRHKFSLTRASWVRSSSLMSVEAIANGVISWQVYHRWFWSLAMHALTSFVENGRRIIRSLYKESCRIAASAPHVMRNQNLTNVRETTTLIRSNAVNIIDHDDHLILLSWIIVSLGDEQSERTRQWSKWPVWVNKHSEWPRPTKRKQLGWEVRTFPFFLW